jgi:hypothetical protein
MDRPETQRCIEFIDGLLGYGTFSPALRSKLEVEKRRLESELAQLNHEQPEDAAA